VCYLYVFAVATLLTSIHIVVLGNGSCSASYDGVGGSSIPFLVDDFFKHTVYLSVLYLPAGFAIGYVAVDLFIAGETLL
jgi:hypothetical protein